MMTPALKASVAGLRIIAASVATPVFGVAELDSAFHRCLRIIRKKLPVMLTPDFARDLQALLVRFPEHKARFLDELVIALSEYASFLGNDPSRVPRFQNRSRKEYQTLMQQITAGRNYFGDALTRAYKTWPEAINLDFIKPPTFQHVPRVAGIYVDPFFEALRPHFDTFQLDTLHTILREGNDDLRRVYYHGKPAQLLHAFREAYRYGVLDVSSGFDSVAAWLSKMFGYCYGKSEISPDTVAEYLLKSIPPAQPIMRFEVEGKIAFVPISTSNGIFDGGLANSSTWPAPVLLDQRYAKSIIIPTNLRLNPTRTALAFPLKERSVTLKSGAPSAFDIEKKLHDMKTLTPQLPLDEQLPIDFKHYIDFVQAEFHHPWEFVFASALWAVSATLRNAVRLEVKRGVYVNGAMNVALLSPPGIDLTETVISITATHQEWDATLYRAAKSGNEKSAWYPSLLPASALGRSWPKALEYNRSGIAVLTDGPSGLIKWLENVTKAGSLDDLVQQRRIRTAHLESKSGTTLLLEPFVTSLSTLRIDRVPELAKRFGDADALNHLLYVVPSTTRKVPWTLEKTGDLFPNAWATVLHRLRAISTERGSEKSTHTLRYDEHNLSVLKGFQADLAIVCNDAPEVPKAVYDAMEMYVHTFALLYEMLRCAYHADRINDDKRIELPQTVHSSSVIAATATAFHFLAQARIAFTDLLKSQGRLAQLDSERLMFYEILPDGILTTEAILKAAKEFAADNTYSYFSTERNVYRFLQDRTLFQRLSRGTYKKVFGASTNSK